VADDGGAAASSTTETFGWGTAPAGTPSAPSWAGFTDVPSSDAPAAPSFWPSASTDTPVAESPATTSIWDDLPPPPAPPAGFALAHAWSTEPTVDHESEVSTETVPVDHREDERTDEFEPFHDVAPAPAESDQIDKDFSDMAFHQVATAYAADHDAPVAEREVAFPSVARWADDDDGEPLPADPNVAEPVDTNRRSRLAGRRSSDRHNAPSTMARTETETALASSAASEDLGDDLAPPGKAPRFAKAAKPAKPPKVAKAPKPPKTPKLPKAARVTKEPVSIDEITEITEITAITGAEAPVAKAARSGFFAKKAPTDLDQSRETPKVLRMAAVASLLVGVGLFGYTVMNGRKSTPTAPPVTIAPATTIAPVSGDEGVPVIAPVEDPIFGVSAEAATESAPVAEVPADDGLAFDTTASFG
jgi:hypothetical protein